MNYFFSIIVQSKGKADEEAEPMVDKKNGSKTTEVTEPQDQIAKGTKKPFINQIRRESSYWENSNVNDVFSFVEEASSIIALFD